jgi:16S rRNA (uracil1498-N3)-methyltransferase
MWQRSFNEIRNLQLRLLPRATSRSMILPALFVMCFRPLRVTSFALWDLHPAIQRVSPPVRRYYHSNVDEEKTDNSPSFSSYTRLPRVFVDGTPTLGPRALVTLSPEQSHYLTNVMRLSNPKRWGDLASHLRIFNGRDGEWLAKLVVSGSSKKRRDEAVVECVTNLVPQPVTFRNVHVWMASPKKQRLKWVLEKATELGVAGIGLVDTDFSSSDNLDYTKSRAHVLEAAEQCERFTLPQLYEDSRSLSDLIQQWKEIPGSDSESAWLICRERSPASLPIYRALEKLSGIRNIHLLIGPEGGWSNNELEQMDEMASDRVRSVSLGPLILRQETAAITAVAAVMLHDDQ